MVHLLRVDHDGRLVPSPDLLRALDLKTPR